MPDRLTLPQLESYLWGAATILRGLVDAGDYKQFIFPLVFYKRLSDVWDEDFAQALATYGGDAELAEAQADERFRVPAGAHWDQVRTVAKDVGRALQDAMRAIEAANPGRFDGIFGDAPWTNKERLPDSTLKDLLEHFAGQTLSTAKVPEDTLGDAYEYLIGKFADDGGHTAQEFYTNRTVVHLMTQMLRPQPGERIYDPTCGTGGMLLSALAQVRRAGGEPRTLRLYGQERNHMTASIARMNLVLHGVLFRKEEAAMRRKLIEADLIDCVLGLGPNLFFNSPMEACVVLCRTCKPPAHQGRILFIDALEAITRERAYSFLRPEAISE